MVATPYQLSFDYDAMAEAAAGSFERASRHLYAFVVWLSTTGISGNMGSMAR